MATTMDTVKDGEECPRDDYMRMYGNCNSCPRYDKCCSEGIVLPHLFGYGIL